MHQFLKLSAKNHQTAFATCIRFGATRCMQKNKMVEFKFCTFMEMWHNRDRCTFLLDNASWHCCSLPGIPHLAPDKTSFEELRKSIIHIVFFYSLDDGRPNISHIHTLEIHNVKPFCAKRNLSETDLFTYCWIRSFLICFKHYFRWRMLPVWCGVARCWCRYYYRELEIFP